MIINVLTNNKLALRFLKKCLVLQTVNSSELVLLILLRMKVNLSLNSMPTLLSCILWTR